MEVNLQEQLHDNSSLDQKELAICFIANIAFIILEELADVTLEWAFAAVGKLVSG